jgi:hypothetical protein
VLPLKSLACNSAIAVAVFIADDAITSVVGVAVAGVADHRLDFPAAAGVVVVDVVVAAAHARCIAIACSNHQHAARVYSIKAWTAY